MNKQQLLIDSIKIHFNALDSDQYFRPIDCDSLSLNLRQLKDEIKNKKIIGATDCIDDIRAATREFRNICLDDTRRKWELYEQIRKGLEVLLSKFE